MLPSEARVSIFCAAAGYPQARTARTFTSGDSIDVVSPARFMSWIGPIVRKRGAALEHCRGEPLTGAGVCEGSFEHEIEQ